MSLKKTMANMMTTKNEKIKFVNILFKNSFRNHSKQTTKTFEEIKFKPI